MTTSNAQLLRQHAAHLGGSASEELRREAENALRIYFGLSPRPAEQTKGTNDAR